MGMPVNGEIDAKSVDRLGQMKTSEKRINLALFSRESLLDRAEVGEHHLKLDVEPGDLLERFVQQPPLLARMAGKELHFGLAELAPAGSRESTSETLDSGHTHSHPTHLEHDHAAEILSQFPERLRNDALLRVATLDGVQPVALKELNDVLTKMLAGGENLKKAALGGVGGSAALA